MVRGYGSENLIKHTMTIYQQSKIYLKEIAKQAKKTNPNDKPFIREVINYFADDICRTWDLSEYQQNLIHNFACTLHPKN